MYSLFCEAKFWTLKDDVQIKNTDLGVLSGVSYEQLGKLSKTSCTSSNCRYIDKKEIDECPYLEGKKSFCDLRGTSFILNNKRPLKLRDRLKELEQQLANNKVVFFDVKDDSIVQLMLNTGLIINIGVNVHSKDVCKIIFDKFLVGKLLSENISDVLFKETHLVISYNESQLTLVNFSKPVTKFNPTEKLIKLEPKIQHVDLCGPAGRRLDRKLSCSKSGDSFLTWWHSTRNEVYPWSPVVKDEDRANMHVYCLSGTKIELLCFHRTEFDLMSVSFSQIKPNAIWLIEQKVSKQGDVAVEYSSHEIVKRSLRKVSVTSIPLQTQICCHSISPNEEKLLLGCIDGSLILFDEPRGITRLVKSAFIPNLISWHIDGALIIVASERSQFQFFDLALSCIKTQFLSDDVNPANLLDLASYFKGQPILLRMKWNKKAKSTFYVDRFIPGDHILLLYFENGPLAVLNLIGGGGLSNDIQNSGLSPDTLIQQYLLWNQNDKALNLLLSLNWNTSGSTCLAGLYHIANHVFRHTFTPEGEMQLEAALGSFYAPIRPLTRSAENDFGNQVHDLTRRFFHLLLRYRLYEKAYCLAIDLSNADLFLDLYYCAKVLENEEMAVACKAKIEELSYISDYSHSSCSRSSCSCSDSDTEGGKNGILPPLPQVSVKKSKAARVPPLPDLNRQNKLRASAFFNCNATYPHSGAPASNKIDLQAATTSFNEFYPSLLHPLSKFLDYNYSTTQILTPEFPHSYEIRTSFSGQEGSLNSFTPSDPAFRTPKNISAFPLRANVIESLYDLPSDLDLPRKDELNFNDPSVNTFGPLKLKSPQNSLSFPKPGPFDYNAPSAPRLLHNGDRPVQMNSVSFNPQCQLYKNAIPRTSPPFLPPKHFNNTMLQRPLHFVPNAFLGQVLKPMNPAAAKQKVKFSDTVTQIVVPDLSKISIEDETLSSQHKSRYGRNTKPSNPSPATTSNVLPQDIGYSNTNRECGIQQEEEENNGAIKVIHFGVV